MSDYFADFWIWFARFAARLPPSDPPDEMLDELLDELHSIDTRIYFELSAEARELILTALGDTGAFPIIDAMVSSVPEAFDWTITALKPAMGFEFTLRHNGMEVDARKLWFKPIGVTSEGTAVAIQIGMPDAGRMVQAQTIDVVWTIVSTGIGERSCGLDVWELDVRDLPDDPAASGFIELPKLPSFIKRLKSRTSSLARKRPRTSPAG